MKKKWYCVVFLCCFVCIVLCACGKKGEPIVFPDEVEINDAPETVTFQATVIETADASIIVKPVEGSWELNSSDQFTVPNEEQLELPIGALVEITYDGSILETYPAQLGEVYKITLIEQTEAK